MIFHFAVFLAGAMIVLAILFSAICTFVLPRGVLDWLTRPVFLLVRNIFSIFLIRAKTYQKQDSVMAFYGPISLIALLPTWITLIIIGYTAMYWGLGDKNWFEAFKLAGSSVLTLGFASSNTLFENILIFSASMIGLLLVALLIAYLPTIYNAYARRENLVNKLEVRAGSPPSALEMLLRFQRIHGLDHLTEQWTGWETWFSEIEESHTSLPALIFFRSPRPNHSWITASGTILDAAALTLSSLNIPYDPSAALCIRAGYLALRDIANEFGIVFNPAPQFPNDAISVSKEEFIVAIETLETAGAPIKTDIEKAWLDYAGWRVNYDSVLIQLAQFTMAPESPWTGDRLDPRINPFKIFKFGK